MNLLIVNILGAVSCVIGIFFLLRVTLIPKILRKAGKCIIPQVRIENEKIFIEGVVSTFIGTLFFIFIGVPFAPICFFVFLFFCWETERIRYINIIGLYENGIISLNKFISYDQIEQCIWQKELKATVMLKDSKSIRIKGLRKSDEVEIFLKEKLSD